MRRYSSGKRKSGSVYCRYMDATWIYAGNMPFNADEKMLTEAFSAFGTVEEVKIARSPEGLFMGFAFVKMGSAEEAAKAVAGLNDKELGGRKSFIEVGSDWEDLWERAFG